MSSLRESYEDAKFKHGAAFATTALIVAVVIAFAIIGLGGGFVLWGFLALVGVSVGYWQSVGLLLSGYLLLSLAGGALTRRNRK